MTGGPLRRWRERGRRIVAIALPFADIMEVALALLTLSPDELATLGWTFADRKRLLDHFLASGKEAQKTARASLDQTLLTLRLPVRDVERLKRFTQRELPKAATHAGIIERLGRVLDAAITPSG
jgi:hypothetical protein